MSGRILLVVVGFCALFMEDASKPLWAQGAYPRVMSPTGRFYGPTQAHYQYERQYGRPWWGGNAPVHPNTGAHINIQVPQFGGFGYGYGDYYINNMPYSAYGYGYQRSGFPLLGGVPVIGGYSGYNGYYQAQTNFGPIQQYYTGPQFQFSWQQQFPQYYPNGEFPRGPIPPPPGEPHLGLLGLRNPGVNVVPRGNELNVQPLGPEEPIINRPQQLLPKQPSTLEQQARSVHFQGQGDIWFRQQNFLQAYSRYKQAASAASDLAAPRFRMAYALIALKRYDLAVTEMARGIQLDPKYPLTGDSPIKVFGPDNQIAANALPGQVADWVRQEMRAPDRLFLLGALLRMNGDLDRSKICFEAAAQIGGNPGPVMAFLKVDQAAGIAKSRRPTIPDDDRPPVPEAVEELLKNNNQWIPGTAKPPAPSAKPLENRNPGPKLIGPPALPSEQPNLPMAPGASEPETEEDPVPPPVLPRKSNPAGPVQPTSGVAPEKLAVPKPSVPGFEPIPKKGSSDESEPSGPVIPIPQSGS